MKNIVYIFLVFAGLSLVSCSQRQQPRMPISHAQGSFMRESVNRNKKLIAGEEARIDSIIKSEPQRHYLTSEKGYWYAYDTRNEKDTLRPHKGDVAFFDYEVKDFDGSVIYSDVQNRPQVYRVDKENIMMGMRDGLKRMHKGETVVFLFPSHMGYGYHGDNKRIGPNTPLVVTVTLNDIRKETDVPTE